MKRPYLPIFLWLACLLGAGVWVGQNLEVSHNLAAFFPDQGRPIETLLISKANRGTVSRTVFAAFAGGSLEQRLGASREARDRLDRLPGIEQTANGGERLDLQAFEPLFPYRYLLGEPQSFATASLRNALETRLKELRSPLGGAVKEKLPSDPTARFRTLLLDSTRAHAAPEREQGLWVTPDRERALLVAILAADEGKSEGLEEAAIIRRLKETLSEVALHHDVALLVAGRPILVDGARESIRASLIFGSIAAGTLVILLLLWVYRSVGVLVLGILPLLSGVLAGFAATVFLFGPMHGIALAFGVTLLGITIDYPLHLFSHGRKGEPLARTASHIQRPILLGALTTAGAFTIFGAGNAPGLDQLACFAGVGILTAALTLRYVVPHLADFFGIQPEPRLIDLLPANAPMALRYLVGIIAIASLAVLISRHDRLFNTDIGVLNPLPEAAKRLDQQLRSDLGAPDLRLLFVIQADDAETVLERAEALAPALDDLRMKGGITGFDLPSTYLPSLGLQHERQNNLPDAEKLGVALADAQKNLPFKSGLFSPFLQSIEQSRTLAPLDGEAGLELFGQTPLGAKLDQLLMQKDNQWYGFVPISGVVESEALRSLAAKAEGVDLIDLKSLSEEILSVFRGEAFLVLALAFRHHLAAAAGLSLPASRDRQDPPGPGTFPDRDHGSARRCSARS